MIDNIGLYRCFFEAAKHGSISAAAKALFVTQPAVSSAIMQLEGLLNVKLFHRASRGIHLTPEGGILYSHIEKAFIEIEAGEDKLREIRGLAGGVMRIGASDMTLRFFLLDYVEAFRAEFPLVRLTVTNAPTPQTLSALRGGQIDFAVVSAPVEESDDLELLPVRQIRDIFVATDDYSVGKEQPVTISELSDIPLIFLERGTSTRRYVDSCINLERQVDFELATSDLVLEFARRGLGIACLVEDFAAEDIRGGVLHEVKLTKPMPPREFLLAYSKHNTLPSAARKFIDMLLSDLSADAVKPRGNKKDNK